MNLKVRHITGAMIALTLGIASREAAAQSFGLYAMPSRFSQYLGCGYGAGHHAPLVRTPEQHPDRIPRHERGAASGPLYVAPMTPLGCYGDACSWPSSPYTPAGGGFVPREFVPPPAPEVHPGRQPLP